MEENNLVKTIQIKEGQRLFFVGDIHGMFKELEKLLEKAGFNKEKDIVIATGDLVDRGTDSHLALDYLQCDWFDTVYGNHEDLLITEHYVTDSPYWRGNGGCWDPKEYTYKQFADVFVDLPIVIEVSVFNKKIGVVHAGVPNYLEDWDFFKEKVLIDNRVGGAAIWDRTRFNAAKAKRSKRVENIDLVISGHSITETILQDENSLFIDTGGFFLDEKFSGGFNTERNRLTMIEILNEDLDYKVF